MRSFGLDISDSVIRLAILEKHGRSFRMPIRGEIDVPDGLITDGEFVQPAEVSAIISKLIEAAKPKTKQAIVTLPERHSFVKVLSLPVSTEVSEANIREAVLPHLPYNWDEMTYDWHVLSSPKGAKETRVLFGGAPKTTVDHYLEALRGAHIEPVGMEIESLAIARAMVAPNSTGAHILLDLGRTRTSLILVTDGVVEFSTTIRYAGKDLNQYIADALHISIDQAQRAKEMFGLDASKGRGLLAHVLSPQLDILVEKIRGIQDYYAERFAGQAPITSILLNGSGALIKNIDVELSKRLGEPVSSQPSWIVSQLSSRPEALHDIAFTYTTAIGLALQPFYPSV